MGRYTPPPPLGTPRGPSEIPPRFKIQLSMALNH
nr:MAG TPA: hypothetical protein [Caudoviricetes sp.]